MALGLRGDWQNSTPPLRERLCVAAVKLALEKSPILTASALYLLGRLCKDVRSAGSECLVDAMRVFSTPELPLLLKTLPSRVGDWRVAVQTTSLLNSLNPHLAPRQHRDALIRAGALDCCVAALSSHPKSPWVACTAASLIRNLTSGCEAAKVAAVSAGVPRAVAVSIQAMAELILNDDEEEDDETFEIQGIALGFPIYIDFTSFYEFAMDNLAFVVAVLGSGGPEKMQPGYDFRPIEARLSAMLDVVGPLVRMWENGSFPMENEDEDALPGVLYALKNFVLVQDRSFTHAR